MTIELSPVVPPWERPSSDDAIPLPPATPFQIELAEALQGLQSAIQQAPAPVVQVAAPDLLPVLEAIRSIRPGPTAQDLVGLFADRRGEGQQFPAEEMNSTLQAVKAALETLDFRMRGIGRAYGGAAGSLALDAASIASLTNALNPVNWSVVSFPATATQASATRPAAPAKVRHVCWGIHASFTQPSTPVAYQGSVILRDGASGAGTILWQQAFSSLSTGFADNAIDIDGLNIAGSANTAMTLEFDAAGGTGTQEAITLTGYDI